MQYGGGLKFFQLKTVWGIVYIHKWYHLIALHSENILSTYCLIIRPIENCLSSTEVQKHHQNHTFYHIFPLQKQPSAMIKIRRSMSSHVCVNERGLMRYVLAPCTLLDARGPKEVSESNQYDLTTHGKFFGASQSRRLDSLKSNLFESQSTLWR